MGVLEDKVVKRVKEISRPILDSLGVELVDVRYGASRRRGLLRLFIDKPGGITLEDCDRVSRFLGPALDVDDPIPYAYTLEVSSPGLDRPLTSLRDFERAIGRLVRFQLRAGTLEARVVAVNEQEIEVEQDGARRKIARDEIVSARLQPEW